MEDIESSSSEDEYSNENKTLQQDTHKVIKYKQKDKTDIYLGRVLVVVTSSLLLSSNYIVYTFFLQRWFKEERSNYQLVRGVQLDNLGTSLFILFQTFFLLSYSNYLRAVFSNPGYMKNIKAPTDFIDESWIQYCKRCKDNKWKPIRAHHCKTCEKCVFRMDHHCTWIHNCVGIGNQKYFILFLIHCFIYNLLVAIYLVFSAILLWMHTPKAFMFFVAINWKHIVCMVFVVLSIIFQFLITEFLSDQFEAIKTNQTTVESYKELLGRPYLFYSQVCKIFGYNNLEWFLPTKPRYDCNYLELLYKETDIIEMQQTNSDYLEDHFNDPNHELFQSFRNYRVL